MLLARPRGTRNPAYEQTRTLLLQRMAARLGLINAARPSLRQLAEAAEVSVPTLRHYFGGRDDIVEAVLLHFRMLGDPYLRSASEPQGEFEASVRTFLASLRRGFDSGRLGDLFATGFREGLLNDKLGPACLNALVDPLIDAVARRLAKHQERGEMKPVDPRHAALMLLSPVLLAVHHQRQMFGATSNPLNFDTFMEDLVDAFVAAYASPQADRKVE